MASTAFAAFMYIPINNQDSVSQDWRRNNQAVICSSTNYKPVHAQVFIFGKFTGVVDDVRRSLSFHLKQYLS